MAGFSCHLLGYVFNRIFTELTGLRGVRYFGVVWTQTFGTFSHPLNIAWMSLTCEDSEVRALAMAMYAPPSSPHQTRALTPFFRVIMGANIAGIYGAQIFRQDDSPLYRRGFGINIAVLTTGLALAIVRYIDDIIRRRRHRRNQTILQAESVSDGGQTKEVEGVLAGAETARFEEHRKQ